MGECRRCGHCLQGYVLSDPERWSGNAAYVFAVYDENAKMQFVGFSDHLRNTLRTVFSRRPEKAYFFK
eukprot:362822-Chlamydomonas_euryale.AAC.14